MSQTKSNIKLNPRIKRAAVINKAPTMPKISSSLTADKDNTNNEDTAKGNTHQGNPDQPNSSKGNQSQAFKEPS